MPYSVYKYGVHIHKLVSVYVHKQQCIHIYYVYVFYTIGQKTDREKTGETIK